MSTILYKKLLKKSRLPNAWKKAHITPIHKKGSKVEPGNYRPLSLTSILGKIMESIIRDQIVEHMMSNDLFSDEQHGFVPGRSCMTQLIVTLELWTELLDSGTVLDVIYLDFRKSFDTVPHQQTWGQIQMYLYLKVFKYF